MVSIATSSYIMQDQKSLQPDFPTNCQTNNNNEAFSLYMESLQQGLDENWRGGYTQMPDEIRQDSTLSPRAKIVYEQLLSYMWFKSDRCWPSQQTLAEATGYSRRTIIRALQDLYNRGYIEKWRRGLGKTNCYFINPISFVRSFRVAEQGQNVLSAASSTQDQADPITLPVSETLCRISHSDTSRSDIQAQYDMPECHTKYTKKKKILLNDSVSNISIAHSEENIAFNIPAQLPKENEENIGRKDTQKDSLSSVIDGKNIKRQAPELPLYLSADMKDLSEDYLVKLGMIPEHKRRPIPEFITCIITDYSFEMGDDPKYVKSNITRAAKMYYTACAIFTDIQDNPEEHFTRMLYLAREDVYRMTNIRHRTCSHINRMPAFFACLENWFSFKPEERAYLYSNEPLYIN